MSFDLAVFRSRTAVAVDAAADLYAALCAGEHGAATAEAALETTARIGALYRALVATYPELGDDEDESPFAAALEQRPYALVMNVSFSRADEVLATVQRLARAHDLDVYDPQARRLVRASDPDRARAPTPAEKLKPKDGLTRLVAGIAPILAAHGFAPAPRVKERWRRTLASGIVHEIGLNQATRDVRFEVGVAHETPLQWLSTATKGKEKLPSMILVYLHYAGWTPGEPWREATDDALEYEICHADCVAKSIAAFEADLTRFALPFFERLSDANAIADFFTRTTTYEPARPNWEIAQREFLYGPSERFVRSAPALLLEVGSRVFASPDDADAIFAAAAKRERAWAKKKAFGWTETLAEQLEALRAAAQERRATNATRASAKKAGAAAKTDAKKARTKKS